MDSVEMACQYPQGCRIQQSHNFHYSTKYTLAKLLGDTAMALGLPAPKNLRPMHGADTLYMDGGYIAK